MPPITELLLKYCFLLAAVKSYDIECYIKGEQIPVPRNQIAIKLILIFKATSNNTANSVRLQQPLNDTDRSFNEHKPHD